MATIIMCKAAIICVLNNVFMEWFSIPWTGTYVLKIALLIASLIIIKQYSIQWATLNPQCFYFCPISFDHSFSHRAMDRWQRERKGLDQQH